RHIRDLAQRRRGTVIIHLDVIKNAGMGTASTHLGEIGLQSLDGLLHFLFCGLFDVSDGHAELSSSATSKKDNILYVHQRAFILTHDDPRHGMRLDYGKYFDRQLLIAT